MHFYKRIGIDANQRLRICKPVRRIDDCSFCVDIVNFSLIVAINGKFEFQKQYYRCKVDSTTDVLFLSFYTRRVVLTSTEPISERCISSVEVPRVVRKPYAWKILLHFNVLINLLVSKCAMDENAFKYNFKPFAWFFYTKSQ